MIDSKREQEIWQALKGLLMTSNRMPRTDLPSSVLPTYGAVHGVSALLEQEMQGGLSRADFMVGDLVEEYTQDLKKAGKHEYAEAFSQQVLAEYEIKYNKVLVEHAELLLKTPGGNKEVDAFFKGQIQRGKAEIKENRKISEANKGICEKLRNAELKSVTSIKPVDTKVANSNAEMQQMDNLSRKDINQAAQLEETKVVTAQPTIPVNQKGKEEADKPKLSTQAAKDQLRQWREEAKAQEKDTESVVSSARSSGMEEVPIPQRQSTPTENMKNLLQRDFQQKQAPLKELHQELNKFRGTQDFTSLSKSDQSKFNRLAEKCGKAVELWDKKNGKPSVGYNIIKSTIKSQLHALERGNIVQKLEEKIQEKAQQQVSQVQPRSK